MHLQFIKTLVSLQRKVCINKIDDLQVYSGFFFLNLGAEGENSSNISIFMQGILPNNANMLIRYVFKQFWDNEIELSSMAIVHMKVVESKSMLL